MRVTLVPSDLRWPSIFAQERERIRAALGGRAIAIEHVGSTAVPGLDAKAIVDVVVEIDGSDDVLEEAGLERHGLGLWKRAEPAVHVHVRPKGSREIARWIRFRDRLRTDDADRALYLETKRRLAEREWERLRDYAEAKDAVIAEILARS